VITLVPVSSGTVAFQALVPLAIPESPVELAHLTEVTPTLSEAVPLKTRLDAVVETIVDPGEPIVNDGGVVSAPPGGGLGVGGGSGVGVGVGTGTGVVEPPLP
jgi:hypothetical protein